MQGIALSADPNYKVLGAAYPWIARRLLTEQSVELRDTLRTLLYKKGRFQVALPCLGTFCALTVCVVKLLLDYSQRMQQLSRSFRWNYLAHAAVCKGRFPALVLLSVFVGRLLGYLCSQESVLCAACLVSSLRRALNR